MKKLIPILAVVGIIGTFVAFRHTENTRESSNAGNVPKAVISSSTQNAYSGQVQAQVGESHSSDRKSSTAIPLIDRTNPVYAKMVRALDGEFLGLLTYNTRGKEMAPGELEEAVKLLTTVRLSQMMHEATISSVASSTPTSVAISIPAYEAEGQSLQRYLESHLNPAFAGRGWETTFDHFGKYTQRIEVSPEGRYKDEVTYTIAHETNITFILGGLKTYSTLTSSTLGGYGVFEPLFPKS